MPHYQFSAIQLVPRPGDGEPLSIGVILYDTDRNVAYRKFTDNWDEVRQRTGLGSLPDLRKVTEEGPFPAKGNYLDALAESQFHDSLLVTAPKRLMDFETHNAALDSVNPTLAHWCQGGGFGSLIRNVIIVSAVIVSIGIRGRPDLLFM